MDHNLEAIWPLDLFVNVGIQIWALDQHGRDLGRQITLEREGRFSQKIAKKSAINRRFFLCRRYIGDLLSIFWRFFEKYRPADLSPPFVVSPPADTRYIGDISPIFSSLTMTCPFIASLGWYLISYSLSSMTHLTSLPDRSSLCRMFLRVGLWVQSLDELGSRGKAFSQHSLRPRLFVPFSNIRFLRQPLLCLHNRRAFAPCHLRSGTKHH